MLTEALKISFSFHHREAIRFANELESAAKGARTLERPVEMDPAYASQLAVMLVSLTGLSNTMIEVLGEAEGASDDMHRAIGLIRRANLRQLISFWLRNRFSKAKTA